MFFNWTCLRTLNDYCDVFNTTTLVLAHVKVIAIPRQKLFWAEDVEPFYPLIDCPEDEHTF